MKKISLSILLAFSVFSATSQTRWQRYDSLYFENLFTPNFSNLLMPKGYVEVIVSNSLLSTNEGWDLDAKRYSLGLRLSYDYTTAIVNVGASKNTRFNIGVEAHYATGYQDSNPESSSLAIFQSSPPGYVRKASGLTSVGPRIKWRPVKRNLNFVYISTVQLPTLSTAAQKNVLGTNRIQWGNTFLYSISAGRHLAFFIQDDIYLSFPKKSEGENSYLNALNFYGYLLVSKHFFPFASVGQSMIVSKKTDLNQSPNSYYVPVGLGLQYQYSLRFTVNVYANQYVWAKNTLDFKTLNVGVRGVF